jgi:hypothetical protein
VLLVVGLSACGSSTSLTETSELNIGMVGTLEMPPDAVGDADPKSLTFQILDASMTTDSGEVTDLYEEDEPTQVRIINRSQIILTAPLTDVVGKTLSKISVTFDPIVEGQGKSGSTLTTTLPVATLDYASPIAVTAGKNVRLDINVQWKDTISRDADTDEEVLGAPALSVGLDEN